MSRPILNRVLSTDEATRVRCMIARAVGLLEERNGGPVPIMSVCNALNICPDDVTNVVDARMLTASIRHINPVTGALMTGLDSLHVSAA